MAEFTFGQSNVSTASGGDGVDNLRISSYDWQGDTLSLSGFIRPTSLTLQPTLDVITTRAQMLGYDDNPDQREIAVTWSRDAAVDGFYRVKSVDVGTEVRTRLALGLTLPWKATLEKVAGYAAPLIEAKLSGAVRSNSHGYSTSSGTLFVFSPGSNAYELQPQPATSGSLFGGFSAEGTPFMGTDAAYAGTTATSWRVSPANYNKTGCRLMTGSSGVASTASATINTALADWRIVTGRQVLNVPTSWALMNGQIRVIGSTTANVVEFFVQSYNSGWSVARAYRITFSGTTALPYDPLDLTVLKVSQAETIIRLTAGDTGSSPPSAVRTTIDMLIRRGCPWVELSIAGTSNAWGVRRVTNEAASSSLAAPGGIYGSSADLDSRLYFIVCPRAGTSDTTVGALRLTSAATTAQFAIGVSSDSPPTPAIKAFFGIVNVTQRIAAR